MEIGGYFGLEDLIHNEYYPELIALNTARNALAYLIKARKIKKLYIPTYLCDSVYKICDREHCAYQFYEVGANFQPLFNKDIQEDEWLYIVNYFGQVTNEVELHRRYKRIIIDNVQAFYRKPIEGIDTLYSCRKFFGVPDGAYLATNVRLNVEKDISMDRMEHVLGRYETTASNYYSNYLNNEETYYDLPIKGMSKLTHNIMGAIDYKAIKRKREGNFQYLFDRLQQTNRIVVKKTDGPFAYPYYASKGMEIKRRLAQQKIYVATLWPTAFEYGGLTKDYAENILPLPCDQRYSLEDMNRIIYELQRIIGALRL